MKKKNSFPKMKRTIKKKGSNQKELNKSIPLTSSGRITIKTSS